MAFNCESSCGIPCVCGIDEDQEVQRFERKQSSQQYFVAVPLFLPLVQSARSPIVGLLRNGDGKAAIMVRIAKVTYLTLGEAK